MDMKKPQYFTICSRNYMAYALTLGRSLRQLDPEAEFIIGLADDWVASSAPMEVEFEILPMADIGLPTLPDMALRYTIMELNTAIKPRLMRYLMEERNCHSVVYLDPDIIAVSKFDELEQILENEPDCILTPHSTAPLDDGADPDDIRLMRTGVYNLGFVAANATEDTIAFLRWWEARLETDCRVALDEGIFVDQKFMDLAPSYMSDVRILRHPGYNLAYWNLKHRPVIENGGVLVTNGVPVRFVHFSGVIPGDRSTFSKHQNRFQVGDIGGLLPLFRHYLDQLEANQHNAWSRLPYAHDKLGSLHLDNFVRRVYATANPYPRRNAPMSDATLKDLCNEPSPKCPELTRYQHEVWLAREDLQLAFDISTRSGREDFAIWLRTSGVREHRIDACFLPDFPKNTVAAEPQESSIKGSDGGDLKDRSSESNLTPFAKQIVGKLLTLGLKLRPIYRHLPPAFIMPIRDALLSALYGRSHVEVTSDRVVKSGAATEDGIAIYGYFKTENGVGEGARRTYSALADNGLKVEAHTLLTNGNFSDNISFDRAGPLRPSRKRVRLYHVNADQTAILVDRLGADAFTPGTYRIGYWAWELPNFPPAWIEATELVDEIWTPSQFTADAVRQVTNKPVHVIPHPLQVPKSISETDRLAIRNELGLSPDDFGLLHIFDFNSYTARKNPWAALTAFKKCREKDKSLKLIFKVHGSGTDPNLRSTLLQEAENTPGVLIVDGALEREAIDRMQWACDAYISLHRSEGFGLNLLECMAKSKPVIATGYSGSEDFIDETVALTVDYKLIDVKNGEYPFAEGQVWAEPDIDQAAHQIMRLIREPNLGELIGRSARARVIARFSPTSIAETISRRLEATR